MESGSGGAAVDPAQAGAPPPRKRPGDRTAAAVAPVDSRPGRPRGALTARRPKATERFQLTLRLNAFGNDGGI